MILDATALSYNASAGVRDLESFNDKENTDDVLPRIVVVIIEFTDRFMGNKEEE